MSATSSTRRDVLAASAAVGAASLLPERAAAATEGGTVRPFEIKFADEQLVDLRRRIDATKWPERETVVDDSQGVQLKTMQEIITLLVFAVFSVTYLGEALKWNHMVAFLFLCAAAFFSFHKFT